MSDEDNYFGTPDGGDPFKSSDDRKGKRPLYDPYTGEFIGDRQDPPDGGKNKGDYRGNARYDDDIFRSGNYRGDYDDKRGGKPEGGGTGFGIASMIIGILSMLSCCCVAGYVPFGAILGVVAIVFAAISLKSGTNGFAVAGLVTGIIGVVIGVGFTVFMLFTDVVVPVVDYYAVTRVIGAL
ncbi:MAG: DUF4190 domain-containing protein [Clostridia bacterium]|nr:DUF4190 domain-containing protein [Clostridia bacterium]